MNENARRLLAVGTSVALVGIALFVREQGGSGDGGGGGDDGTLVCPPELRSVCEAAAGDLSVRIEEARATADALLTDPAASPGVDGDVWLVPRPWVEAVAQGARDPVLGSSSEVIARSPVVLVVAASRADTLSSGACGGAIGWACVGDVAEGPWTAAGGPLEWGTVRAGIARPDGAAGLTLLGAAAGDFLGTPAFASNDFGGPLDNWLSKLAASSRAAGGQDPVADMITQGPGYLASLGTLEAFGGRAFGHDAVRVVVPQPVVTADLIAVPILEPGDDPEDGGIPDGLVDDDLQGALAEAGWRVEGRDLASGLDPDLALPDEPGVPRGDVLWALLQRWSELV